MPTLSSSIVQHQVASLRDVEEALSRQVLYGGDLATNLLELATVSESALTRVLAETSGLQPVPSGELQRASEAVRRLVPSELALRHGFYPLEERDGALVVAVAEPLSAEVEEDLSFALGLGIVQRAAPLVRIRQAISRDYAITLDRRTQRLIAKLDGMPDPSPSSLPPPQTYTPTLGLPRPPTVPPLAFPGPASEAPASPAPKLTSPERPRESSPDQPRARRNDVAVQGLAGWVRSEAQPRARKRRIGPYTVAMAEQDLQSAETRDDVLRAFFDFAAQYFEYSALFVIHGDLAEGRDAQGPGASAARVNTLGVPLDLPSSLADVRRDGTWHLTRLHGEGIDASFASDLQREIGQVVLLLPIVVRGRGILILYGDHGTSDVELEKVADVMGFAPLVSAALERIIVRKKAQQKGAPLSGAEAGAKPMPRVERPKARLPAMEQRAQALAQALRVHEATPAETAPTEIAAPMEVVAPARVAGPPHVETATDSDLALEEFQLEDLAGTPLPEPEPRSAHRAGQRPPVPQTAQVPAAHGTPSLESMPTVTFANLSSNPPAPSPADMKSGSGSYSGLARPVITIGPARQPATPPQGTPSPPAAKAAMITPADATPLPLSRQAGGAARLRMSGGTGESSPEIALGASEIGEEFADAVAHEEAPLAPSSRKVAYSARRPRPRQSSNEIRLPTVIVDYVSDCRELVRRLIGGDPEAGDKLVEIGEPAISPLIEAFPGPISGEPRRAVGDGPARASDYGPVLRTLMRLGSRVAPFVIVRTNDIDPVVRSWATRLLGELPSVEAAAAVVRRLSDADAEVRRAALAAARLLQSHPEARTAIRDELLELAAAPARPMDARQVALEALADLRDPRSVSRLIRILSDSAPEIVKSAHWALVVISRQDFGRSADEWQKWWDASSNKHRIEWLIDALMHDVADIRRAAGDELKSLTKEYFGYYDDLPKKERARAQQRYREWWESKGKARFP
ncbi:MAG TPA: hypothetical protein VI072_22405 [Polyangiaceae bacterium]